MPRPKKYDETLRQALILSAAVRIGRTGVESLTVRSLAQQHGCSTTAIYSMFGGKEQLVTAVIREAVHSFSAAQEGVRPTGDAINDLSRLCAAYRGWAQRYPEFYMVMFGGRLQIPTTADGLVDEAEQSIGPLTSMVQTAIDAGVLRGAPAPVMAQSLWASTHGIVSLELTLLAKATQDERDRLFEAHMSACLAGWLVDPGALPAVRWRPPGVDEGRVDLLLPRRGDARDSARAQGW